MENVGKVSKISRDDKEKIAMQHTIQSAISSEFQNLSLNEKIAMVSAIHVAFVDAFNTGKPICPSINYRITPELYNEFLAHTIATGNEHTQAPLKVLTLKELKSGIDEIFEREINYHEYIGKRLIIFKARLIPSFKIIFKDNTENEITDIQVNICIALTRELNKILVKSKGSLTTALKLTIQLLDQSKPQVKDIDKPIN